MSSGTKYEIHPSIVDKIDPESVAFHNAHLLYRVPTELRSWDAKIRLEPAVPGASELLEVGDAQDHDLPKAKVRVFTPKGDRPTKRWPIIRPKTMESSLRF